MSIHPIQLRTLIKEELNKLNPQLVNGTELLMFTAAAETHCGTWLWQHTNLDEIPDNLAYGIFQMEALAYRDACNYILRYKPNYIVPPRKRLITDLQLAIWTARCYYLRFAEPIPKDEEGLARYWKKYWNTEKGKGTIDAALWKYLEFVK
jgi:hypothetical protein